MIARRYNCLECHAEFIRRHACIDEGVGQLCQSALFIRRICPADVFRLDRPEAQPPRQRPPEAPKCLAGILMSAVTQERDYPLVHDAALNRNPISLMLKSFTPSTSTRI